MAYRRCSLPATSELRRRPKSSPGNEQGLTSVGRSIPAIDHKNVPPSLDERGNADARTRNRINLHCPTTSAATRETPMLIFNFQQLGFIWLAF
jgi:hypothetical protein